MRVMSAAEAVALIQDKKTLASSGFRFAAAPEELLLSLGKRFRESGKPKGLKLVYSAAQGDSEGRGLDHLAQHGLLREVVGGFFGSTPKLRDLIGKGDIAAYNLPQGQIALLYRAIAAHQPGVITDIGLDTFVDPRLGGGKLTKNTPEDAVELVTLRGREWLLYKAFPIDVCFIRGTSADEYGNISLEKEAVRLEGLPIAAATKNSGGIVIVQVERLVKGRSINPQRVEIPGHLVDVVVVSEHPETNHQQALHEQYNPSYNGEVQIPGARLPPPPPGVRRLLARRAAQELEPGQVVNLGQGIPEGIGAVASDSGLMEKLWTSLESGVIGGIPTKHVNFGVAINPMAIIRHDDQFTIYNGGGVDISFLGFAQIDGTGAVNVSSFNNQFIGAGGFIDIASRTRRLVFCGMFDAGGTELEMAKGKLTIKKHGKHRKFVEKVEQITFAGHRAVAEGRSVMLVTERAVFNLEKDGWVLTEVAPGVRQKEDVLDQMGFKPRVGKVKEMDPALFRDD